jgi:hypothetical protein
MATSSLPHDRAGPDVECARPQHRRELAAATQALRRPLRTGRTWPWETSGPVARRVATHYRCNGDPIPDTSDHPGPLNSCNWLVRRL